MNEPAKRSSSGMTNDEAKAMPLVPYTYDFAQAPISLRVEPGRVLINMQPAGSHPITALFELEALDKLIRACMDAKLATAQEGT